MIEQDEVRRIVDVLRGAGVLTAVPPEGELPDGDDVLAADVLSAAYEQLCVRAPLHVDPVAELGPVAFHDSHVEQLTDSLAHQVADLVRLGGLDDVTVDVELDDRSPTAVVPTTLRITDGTGVRTATYAGAAKYLSTVVHVELARLLHRRSTGTRLAWTWNDQGVWLTALTGVTVDELNTALGPAAGDGFTWVDQEEPIAAGEMYG